MMVFERDLMSFPTLSVIQPWPWLILRPDLIEPADRAAARAAGQMKDIENRTWSTDLRCWVLLHASRTRLAKWDYQSATMFAAKRNVELPMRDNMPYGAVVGAIRIDGVVAHSQSPWFMGPLGFVVGAAVPFLTPVECLGTLKVFPLPPVGAGPGGVELEASLAAQLRAVGLTREFHLP